MTNVIRGAETEVSVLEMIDHFDSVFEGDMLRLAGTTLGRELMYFKRKLVALGCARAGFLGPGYDNELFRTAMLGYEELNKIWNEIDELRGRVDAQLSEVA